MQKIGIIWCFLWWAFVSDVAGQSSLTMNSFDRNEIQLPGNIAGKYRYADVMQSPKALSGIGLPKFILSFDSRNSFVLDRKVKMNGLKIGLEFKDKYRYGFGFYNLDNPIDIKPVERKLDTLQRSLRFRYTTIFAEYVVYEDFRWETSMPLSFGRGFGTVDTISSLYRKRGEANIRDAYVITLSGLAFYKPLAWLAVGGGAGYRQMISSDEGVREAFNAPFYIIKLKILLGQLIKSIFRPAKIKEEKEEYIEMREQRRKQRKEKWNNLINRIKNDENGGETTH